MKINFTEVHFEKMKEGLLQMLIDNETVTNSLGSPLNVVELLHTTTIQSLNRIRISIENHIKTLENRDEWVSSITDQAKLNKAKRLKETINLIIGYKRYLLEKEELESKKEELKNKINQMKEEVKTPEDRLREAEAELASLENPKF